MTVRLVISPWDHPALTPCPAPPPSVRSSRHWFYTCQNQSSPWIENKWSTFTPTKLQLAQERSGERKEQPWVNCVEDRGGLADSSQDPLSWPRKSYACSGPVASGSGVLCFQVPSSQFSTRVVSLKQNLSEAKFNDEINNDLCVMTDTSKKQTTLKISSLDGAWVQVQFPVTLLFLWPNPPHFLV